ncbi:hypothetical protein IWW36_002023 [Coemansia brasiliensis]|uniref:Uncharacterized protein n=1 Tax=Coemansia brasiliensis TaxID=2650707 RepID=A0A9W8I7V4_9FUNG|nr:hypothetical protein IWW36_002023 [Coemansia brasiliensis]
MPRPARKSAKRSSRAANTRTSTRKESQKQAQKEEQENSVPSTPITSSPRYGRRSITGSSSSSRRLSLNSKVFDGLIDDLSPIKPGNLPLEPTLLTPQSDNNASKEDSDDSSSDDFDIDALVLKSSTKKRRRNEPPSALDILPQRTRTIKPPTPTKSKKTRLSAKSKRPSKAKKSKPDDIWTAAGYIDDVDGYELAEEAV